MDPTEIRTHSEMELDDLSERLRALGLELSRTLRRVLEEIPGQPHMPTPLARRLLMSRVIVSKLLNALVRNDPFEVLEQLPGPESLRVLLHGARQLGVAGAADEADRVVERFAAVIRDDFGTRGALNAAISSSRPGLQLRFEHASRYQVFKGMRQILGVEADVWLTSMMFAPSRSDASMVEVTTIHGALGLRRLRPGVGVYFTFGAPRAASGDAKELSETPVDLSEFCVHEPALLETSVSGGQLVHRLTHDRLGRHALVDMLAVSHNGRGSRRYASAERPRGGLVVYPDVPVKTLICDALVHESIFPSSTPELFVFNPGARGPANPNDRSRDIDRIDVPERIEAMGVASDRFAIADVPNYHAMVERVCGTHGRESSQFRLFRLRMAYPVHGFQFVMAFDAPAAP